MHVADAHGTPRRLCRWRLRHRAIERRAFLAIDHLEYAKMILIVAAFVIVVSIVMVVVVQIIRGWSHAGVVLSALTPVFIMASVPLSLWATRSIQREKLRDQYLRDGVCPSCEYDIGASSGPVIRCPECGVEWADPDRSKVESPDAETSSDDAKNESPPERT